VIALVLRSFARIGSPLVALLAILAGFQVAIVGAAASFAASGDFERLSQLTPAFLLQTIGPALISFDGMVTIGYFDALLVMLLVQFAIYVATEPAADVESGMVDLVLARPLPRHWVISRSLLVMLGSILALTAAMAGASVAGLWWLAPANERWPELWLVLTFLAYLTVIAFCFGSLGLAASGWARRRSSAFGGVAIIAVAAYLLDLLGMMWPPVRMLARISPFHYFRGSSILSGVADPVLDLGVLGMIAVAGIALAYWQFARRDL
jgi:ABC-2 type transport system permease protein